MAGFRIGADIGGTFTDIVFLSDSGRLFTKKVSSSVDNYARAIIEGVAAVLGEQGLDPGAIDKVLHATTVGSNAILEHKGARTGLITTRGFRDILELRRLRMPQLYDMRWEKPPPLVERYLRREIAERIDHHGDVEVPLDVEEVERQVDFLVGEKVEAVAVALINSYVNPTHERQVRDVIQRRAPGLLTCLSSDVLPEIREYERTSTTVINAYVMPIVRRYCERLRQDLDGIAVRAPLQLMQSNGGLTTAEAAAEMPCHIIELGPAAGVVGAQALARKLGLPRIITLDMGGTTAKASIVENGEVTRASEYQVGAGIMIGSRLLTGAGYMLKVPAIDLAEVGAGGGSHVWIDPAGSMHVGPHSAGSTPGPVCYDAGGEIPTITDANVVLGYLNPDHLVGGEVRLNAAKARTVFRRDVAEPLGLSVEHAAYGAYMIAASNMIRAIKAVSSERGRDPRDYALFAFGGNGAIFAAAIAKALTIARAVIPPCPGVFSSFGLLYSEIEHHYSRTCWGLVRDMDPAALAAAFADLEAQANAQLRAEGFVGRRARFLRTASARYAGQSYELTIPVAGGRVTRSTLAGLAEAFEREHERTYGHRAGANEPVEIVSVQVVGQGVPDKSAVPDRITVESRGDPARRDRPAYFGPEHGWLETPVILRSDLAKPRKGPCIEEYDATCVVPPDAQAMLDDYGNIILDFSGAAAAKRSKRARKATIGAAQGAE